MTVAEPSLPAMKVCYRCKESKSESEFNKSNRTRDRLHSYCRDCQKQHYRENAIRHRANVRRNDNLRIARLREVIYERMSHGCVDCGNRDIRVLEFDHVRGTKVRGVGAMVTRGAGFEAVVQEMDKCEVRCKNCHAIATSVRRGGSCHDDFQPRPPQRAPGRN